MTDPVFYSETEGGWCFWDETWADYIGPFATELDAREELAQYIEHYLR